MNNTKLEPSQIEHDAVSAVLDDCAFLWWRHFRSHFENFKDGFETMAFYSDVFSIIAEQMSKENDC